ncbi:hypothetical protein AND_005780 [Anopheles darlingi]|uniref:Peptidase S1 domain-containing protein n=1 Tax=Anopheles darlingi TaxID=43151 RepID=W5JEN5_ANODA|nr:hypothetical protein AND_005780 [Anopheles darlingi]
MAAPPPSSSSSSSSSPFGRTFVRMSSTHVRGRTNEQLRESRIRRKGVKRFRRAVKRRTYCIPAAMRIPGGSGGSGSARAGIKISNAWHSQGVNEKQPRKCHLPAQNSKLRFTVAVGSNPNVGNAKVYNYASVEIHKDFDSTTRANDVAIVTINGTFDGAPNVHPITIATREIVVSTTNRTQCVVVGYEQTSDFAYTNILTQAQYELLTDQECTTAFNQTLPPSDEPV